jgi:membrane fusion protein, multidrug efflux system
MIGRMPSLTFTPPLLTAGVVAFSILLASCGSKNNDPPPRAAGSMGASTVKGIVVTPQALDNIVRSSGTVLPSEAVDLAAEAAGRVVKIAFEEGRPVARGALLVKLNDDDLQAQLRKVELQIQLAQEQENRQKHLFEMNGISKEQYDISLNQVNMLIADRDNLVAAIRKREVRAPFDGVVGLRYVSEGAYVSQTTRIASMQRINPLKVDFAIPEKYAGEVAVGDLVHFRNEKTTQQFVGRLYAIEPKIDPTMGTLQLRARFDNPSGKLFPGAYVQIELRLKQMKGALMVPTQAIIPVLKGQTVLVRRNGIVVSVPVRIGVRTATTVQITEGLASGDTVITTGIMQLRPGMPVRVSVQ